MKLNDIEVLRLRLDEEHREGYGQCMHIGIGDLVMFRVNYSNLDKDFYITFMGCIEIIRNDYSFEFLDCKTEEEAIEKCKGIMKDYFNKFTDDRIEFGKINIRSYNDA